MAKKSSNLSLKAIRLPIRRERRPRVPTHVTSIDLDGAVLRVAQTSQRGGVPALTRVAVAPLEFPAEADRSSPAVVGAAIRRAFAHLKLSPGSVVMGVPRAQVVLRTLQVPVIHDLRELASVVHLQISRDLPFRMEEAVVDFKVRPASDATPAPAVDAAVRPEGVAEAPAPRLEVLVAAVKREVVEFYLQAAEAGGVKLMALGLLPYANARCVEACQVADGDTAFAVVTLRPDEVGIDVVAEQALRFSRGATIRPAVAEGAGGAADSPRPENFADAATLEVVRSLHSYGGMEPNRPRAWSCVPNRKKPRLEPSRPSVWPSVRRRPVDCPSIS